jgi:hypothetical protein
MTTKIISLANARRELVRINNDLLTKCGPTFRLEIDQYKYKDENAAVYHGKNCVSSVTGRYDENKQYMELLSKTLEEYEGLKYNIFLRTVFMYLMYYIRPSVNTIYSHSLNPISTYAMFKHYHATNEDLHEYVKANNLTPDTFTVEDAKKFHNFYHEKYKQTIESAKLEIDSMLEDCAELNGQECTINDLGWDTEDELIEFIIKTMSPKAITLEVKLNEPGVNEYLHNKINISISNITCSQSIDSKQLNKKRKFIGGKKTIKLRKTIKRRKITKRRKNN